MLYFVDRGQYSHERICLFVCFCLSGGFTPCRHLIHLQCENIPSLSGFLHDLGSIKKIMN